MTAVLASGKLAAVLQTAPADRSGAAFLTTPTCYLDLDHHGIPGSRHHGALRRAGAREPWLPRGTLLRNDRQLSALCPDELAEIAAALAIEALLPQWLGGNLVVEGVPGFSRIAPGCRFAIGGTWGGKGRFDGTAVLRVEAYNAPCRLSGRVIAAANGRPELEFAFVKAAARLRGLVLSVDLPGPVAPGDMVVVLKPMQG